ncbi:MAG TPA: hypothetical protein VF484_06205 [Candidatus Limnocylindrales bacterium]
MTDPRPAQGAHASHDLFVIAAAADRDADAATRAAADRQMRYCGECTALFADLHAILTGLATMPRELPAHRDFRLSPERAAQLRRGGLRRVLHGFRLGPSLRPMGTALATLGFAGLVLTVGLPMLTGGFGASSGAAPIRVLSTVGSAVGTQSIPGAAEAPGPTAANLGSGDGKSGSIAPANNGAGGGAPAASAAAASSPGDQIAAQNSPPTVTGDGVTRDTAQAGGPAEAAQPNPVDVGAIGAWLSLGALVVGLALLVFARFGARARA